MEICSNWLNQQRKINSEKPTKSQNNSQKQTRKRRARCPNGYRRNPFTGICEPFHKPGSATAIAMTKKKRTRCPNGTRKDPTTGQCVPIPTQTVAPVQM